MRLMVTADVLVLPVPAQQTIPELSGLKRSSFTLLTDSRFVWASERTACLCSMWHHLKQPDKRLEDPLSRRLKYEAGKSVLATRGELSWGHGPKASVPHHVGLSTDCMGFFTAWEWVPGMITPRE